MRERTRMREKGAELVHFCSPSPFPLAVSISKRPRNLLSLLASISNLIEKSVLQRVIKPQRRNTTSV